MWDYEIPEVTVLSLDKFPSYILRIVRMLSKYPIHDYLNGVFCTRKFQIKCVFQKNHMLIRLSYSRIFKHIQSHLTKMNVSRDLNYERECVLHNARQIFKKKKNYEVVITIDL